MVGWVALAHHHVLDYFSHAEVSGDLGLSKPDPRFLERVLRVCGVSAAQAIMVGDRLDNDIVPARLLGMKTILVRTGRYAGLQPRYPGEAPDIQIQEVAKLVEAVEHLALGNGCA
jgi:FMN phosphatase YigB (HAD superfamily)